MGELENIILREVSHTQKINIISTHSYVAFRYKKTRLQFTREIYMDLIYMGSKKKKPRSSE